MSKFNIEIIESGIELSNNELFDLFGGAADCACKCFLNFRVLCLCVGGTPLVECQGIYIQRLY